MRSQCRQNMTHDESRALLYLSNKILHSLAIPASHLCPWGQAISLGPVETNKHTHMHTHKHMHVHYEGKVPDEKHDETPVSLSLKIICRALLGRLIRTKEQ